METTEKKVQEELNSDDLELLKQARNNADVKKAAEAIDKILKQFNCHIIPDGNSPLNAIRIMVVKSMEKPPEEQEK